MNFPKTLVFLIALNLTMATEFTCAAPAVPTPTPSPIVIPPAQTAAAATEDIRDIRGPISIPYGWLWAAYAAGSVVLAAAAYGGWRWYRRHAAERARLPHEVALDRLDEARALMTESQAREYSFAVSEITRCYIEASFHERAARRTTEEFLHDLLAATDTPLAAYREQLGDVLEHCDLAKFARWQLAVPDMAAMHASARAFILETQPTPAKTHAPAAGGRNGHTPHTPAAQPTHS